MKKIRSRAGSTLVELLATIAIMAIVFSMLGAGIAAIRTSYLKVTLRAEAQTALSTVIQIVEGDLRTATSVKLTDDGESVVNVGSSSRGYVFYYDKDKVVPAANAGKAVDLLSAKAADDGKLKVSVDGLMYKSTDTDPVGYFEVTVTVTADDQVNPETQTVDIRPMSQPSRS